MRRKISILLAVLLSAAAAQASDDSELALAVGFMAVGNFADWATSWKWVEYNPILAETAGPYKGRFYHRGTAVKAGVVIGMAGATLLLAKKVPWLKRPLIYINIGAGAAVTAAAISNVARNPYYR